MSYRSVLLGLCSGSLCLAAPPVSDDKSESVHVCWPIDETGLLTGTTVRFPIDPAVLEYQAQRERNSSAVDNRVDFVFVGDGYTAGELEKYTTDVTNVVAKFFRYEPFIAYRSYFRITQVDVVSSQSGVDHDPQGTFRNTALDMGYWCSGIERLLCVDTSKAYAAATNAGVPDIDQIIALANSTKYGGAGYASSDLATAAGRNSSSVQVAIHEIGHSMGNLADEYTSGGPTTYTGTEPSAANVSIYTTDELVTLRRKWHLWAGATSDPRFDGPIGTYEGAMYSFYGIYRPTSNSMMRSLGRPFNQPSSEALIKSIYREVSPIDDAADNAIPLGDIDTLWVTPMRPIGHTLEIRWTVDGQPQTSLDGLESIPVASLALAQGVHTVSVTVTDPTDMVRNENFRANKMTATRSWSIDLACVDLADTNGDGIIDEGDITAFVVLFLAGDANADLNGDGFLDSGDLGAFVDAFLNPC